MGAQIPKVLATDIGLNELVAQSFKSDNVLSGDNAFAGIVDCMAGAVQSAKPANMQSRDNTFTGIVKGMASADQDNPPATKIDPAYFWIVLQSCGISQGLPLPPQFQSVTSENKNAAQTSAIDVKSAQNAANIVADISSLQDAVTSISAIDVKSAQNAANIVADISSLQDAVTSISAGGDIRTGNESKFITDAKASDSFNGIKPDNGADKKSLINMFSMNEVKGQIKVTQTDSETKPSPVDNLVDNLSDMVIADNLPHPSKSSADGQTSNKSEDKKQGTGFMPSEAGIKLETIQDHAVSKENFAKSVDGQHVSDSTYIKNLSENMPYVAKKGDASVNISVEHDSMGKLDIKLVSDKGMINGYISASDNIGKEVMERNLNNIVHSLLKDGLNVGSFSVSLKDKGNNARDYSIEKDTSGTFHLRGKNLIQVASVTNNMINLYV